MRRLALRTLLAAFPGESPPDWTLGLVTEGLAGYALFGPNIGTAGQVAELTAALRSARGDVVIATDEEGGDVTRLAHRTGSPYPGNAALGAVGDPEVTRTVYAAIGGDLARAGIDLDLAPVVDVNSEATNPIIGTRSFGSDPAEVARHSAAAVAGLQSTGVAACAKHFPGHGATVTDSHLSLPTVDVPVGVLRERDLPPFAAAVEAGVRAIMTAHIRVPALTGTGPATFSRAVVTDLLRGELGFRGAVVTDALEMKGATLAAGSIGAAAVLALEAGADLLCLGARVGPELIETVVAAIVEGVQAGRLSVGRLEEARERTAGLTRSGGTLPARDDDLGFTVARRAVRIEGRVDGLIDPVVVQLPTDRVEAPRGRTLVLVGQRVYRYREAISALVREHGGDVVVVEMGWPSDWRPAGVRGFVTTYGASLASERAAGEILGLCRLPHKS